MVRILWLEAEVEMLPRIGFIYQQPSRFERRTDRRIQVRVAVSKTDDNDKFTVWNVEAGEVRLHKASFQV